jgi:Ca2+-binding RTX toxin-like protein
MSGHVSLQDLVYFGTAWQLLNGTSAQTAPIVLGDGYRNASVLRSADGNFFAGVVEKVDAAGAVTDVILAFAGAAGAEDFVEGNGIRFYLPSSQAEEAVALFEQLLADPRYQDAVVHVTGHSLGAAFTQYVLAHSLSVHGEALTAARADFVQFAGPPDGQAIASHFGLPLSAFDGHITGYVAQNDLVLDVLDQGATQMGMLHYLAPNHALPLAVGVDNVSAHYPTTFIDALGLPAWLGADVQADVRAAIVAQSNTPIANDYGPAGSVSMLVVGDGADNLLAGSSTADVLIGRMGQDVLRGGLGADLFVFETSADSSPSAPDLIVDFSRAQGDKIDLRNIMDDPGQVWPAQLHFVGTAPLSGPGQVRAYRHGNDTWVEGAFGTGSEVTFAIKLAGVQNLVASDFLLNDTLFQPHYTIGFVPY